MTTIEMALRMAATNSDDLKSLIKELDEYRARKIEDERLRKEAEIRRRENEQHKHSHDEKRRKEKQAEMNKAKRLYSWTIRPESYSAVCGIVWAYNERDAIDAISKKFEGIERIKISEVDCSEPIKTIGCFYE